MKIRRIKWKNYRPYDDHEMSFTDDRPTVVINWVNGVGKTSFLNSIYWCLYGEEIFPLDRYIANGNAVKETLARDGQLVRVAVFLEFRSNSGATIRLNRTQDFRVHSVNHVQPVGVSNLEATSSRSADTGFSPIGDAQGWVSQHFPRRLSPHFFLDGQNLQNFRVEAAPRKEAIASIAALDALQRQIEHLGTMKNELTSQIRKRSRSDSEAVRENVESLRQQVDMHASIAETFEKDIRQFHEQYGDPDDLEKEHQEIKVAKERIEELYRQRDAAKMKVSEAEASVAETFDAVPLVLLQPEIAKLISRGESARHSVFTKGQLEALLERGVCVCGSPLDGSSSHREHIESLMESLQGDDALTHLDASLLKQLNAKALQSRGSLKAHWAQLRREEQQVESLTAEIKSFESQNETLLDGEVGRASPEQILGLVATYRDKVEQLNSARAKRDEKQAELDELQEELLNEEVDENDPRAALQKEVRFVQHLITHADKIHREGLDAVRARLSDTFEQLFRQMVGPDGEAFSSVSLDEDLNMKVLDDDEQERQDGFSAGWALVAAFAFAYALNAIAGFELPLVVDTPFGNLSKERKQRLAQTLSTATKDPMFSGRQFIILVTDVEADHGVTEALSGVHTDWYSGHYNQSEQTISFSKRSA